MSDIVSLHCPKCGQKLKIKDRSLFGRKVKCPDCKQSFVLVDPDGPELNQRSAEPDTETPKPQSATQTGGFPIFETPTEPGSRPAPAPPPSNPFDFSQPSPPTDLPFGFPATPASPAREAGVAPNPFGASAPPAPPAPVQNSPQHLGQPPAAGPIPSFPIAPPQAVSANESPIAKTPVTPGPAISPALGPALASAGFADIGAEPISQIRRSAKRSSKSWVGLAGGLVVVVLILGGVAFSLSQQSVPQTTTVAKSQDPTGGNTPAEAVDPRDDGIYSKVSLERDPKLVAEFAPTQGKPIELLMVPSGINLVIHLRPALLWSDEYAYRVLRASLTDDVMNWLAAQIKTYCRRDPAQIEEVTFGILFGPRGTMPQVCSVVHLKEPEKMSALIAEFPGKYLHDITQKPDLRIKVDDQHGVLIADEKTFAICPAELASELEFWIKTPNYEVSDGIAEQLKQSDRQRLFTVIGTVSDLEIHMKELVPAASQPLMGLLLEWLGMDIETVGWSIHPEPYLHSQLFLRSASAKSPMALEKELIEKLDQMPNQVWQDVCLKMSPAEVRFRTLIGRLPAMLEAFQESTVSQREGRNITLTTVLPAKAAPNLALATLFAVNEAARTNFSDARPEVAATGNKPQLPTTVAGRIELPVDAEFNRTPLEQALQFLCDEIQVTLFVDGDALKDAGYTKNMPQTFVLGKVPMKQALSKVIDTYQERDKEMVACFDDAKMLITVTTKKFAIRDGLKISLPAGQ